MIYCLNPNCQKPQNPDTIKFCRSCGKSLLLRGRYIIVRPLSQGGFAKTYLAQDEDRRRAICVVKQFAPSMFASSAHQKAVQLFNQEAEKLLHLEDHPQIPTLYAYFEEAGCLYLVQQFIKGQTLMEEWEQKGNFNELQIRELMADLLPLLQFIHERKVIHRDIKPDNIIRRSLSSFVPHFGRPVTGQFVLIDFGVAKQWTGNLLSQQGTMTGTPGYAPIEQMRGVAYPASDLYSLAVTCIRLMTGCFPTNDGYDEIYNNLDGRWLWREKLPSGITVSQPLGEIFDKLLNDYAKERYQSAQEVLAVLSVKVGKLSSKNKVNSLNNGVIQSNGNSINYSGVYGTDNPAFISSSPSTAVSNTTTSRKKSQAAGKKKGKGAGVDIKSLVTIATFEFDVVKVDARGKQIQRQRKSAEFFPQDLGNGVILEMVSIPGGNFLMGSVNGKGSQREYPQHSVTIAPFFMGKFPVTQAQWQAVASLPKVKRVLDVGVSKFKGENKPVEGVSWDEAVEFCARLSQKTGLNYRLPSEAEWEYACRAGTSTLFHFGETLTPDLANYDGEHSPSFFARKRRGVQETTNVGSFQVANDFGLYDMHGNVWEWCADIWHENYQDAPLDGKVWNAGGDRQYRVQRGGSWCSNLLMCRCAYRDRDLVDKKEDNLGFRVVC